MSLETYVKIETLKIERNEVSSLRIQIQEDMKNSCGRSSAQMKVCIGELYKAFSRLTDEINELENQVE